MKEADAVYQILDLARWAPSGDNTQPWRFEVRSSRHVVVHGFDTRDHCVYDLDGHPSQIALGALIETAAIAASAHHWRLDSQLRTDSSPERLIFDWHFSEDPTIKPDPLCACIQSRSVQRRPLRTQALSADEKSALSAACAPGFDLLWLEGFSARLQTAQLMFHSAKIRLTSPEAYEVHRDIIDWRQQFSTDKVPEQALGTDPMTTRLMEFVMGSWERVQFFNRFLAGTWAPRIQLDWLPSLMCGAHFALLAKAPAQSPADYVQAGRAMQRVWLTATRLGLQMQPEVTPLVFTRYAREQRRFSRVPQLMEQAEQVRLNLEQLIGKDASQRSVFMGRLGHGTPPRSRSLRRPLNELIQATPSNQEADHRPT